MIVTTVAGVVKDGGKGLIDELTYISYRHNRGLSPDVSPERWTLVFGERTKIMEERYQKEAKHDLANPTG